MLLWSRRSRAAILVGFAVVVLVVFVAPLATVVVAGLAGSWTEALPSDLGFGHFDDALSGENLASLSVSLQTAFIAGGIALVLGLTTRFATALALFLLLNYMCAKGAVPWGPGIDQSDIVLALIIFLTDAGRTFGIDKLLADRFPKFWIL